MKNSIFILFFISFCEVSIAADITNIGAVHSESSFEKSRSFIHHQLDIFKEHKDSYREAISLYASCILDANQGSDCGNERIHAVEIKSVLGKIREKFSQYPKLIQQNPNIAVQNDVMDLIMEKGVSSLNWEEFSRLKYDVNYPETFLNYNPMCSE